MSDGLKLNGYKFISQYERKEWVHCKMLAWAKFLLKSFKSTDMSKDV